MTADRPEKARKHNAGMHVPEQSDRVIVPWKGQNNFAQAKADAPEGRTWAKENPKEDTGSGTQRPNSPVHKIRRVRERSMCRLTLHPRQEPYEVVPHVRICAGGAQ